MTSKKLDLLPCPFCGSSRIEIHEEFGGSSCSKCGALGPTRGPKDMLQRWNQRYSADEPPTGQYCEHGVRSDLRCFSCSPASSQPPGVSSAAVEWLQGYFFDTHNAKYSLQVCRAVLENALAASGSTKRVCGVFVAGFPEYEPPGPLKCINCGHDRAAHMRPAQGEIDGR
jgi:hypothetical protein